MSGFNTSLLHDGVDDYPNGATLVLYISQAHLSMRVQKNWREYLIIRRWDSHIRESIIRR